ncbi:MAG: hypothetical protein V7L25_17275 [Nostoc sp.]|uniref:hypothetical protein n=1 Tax=Nostoc sp. TaxID=1180 RepID=UPI002FEEF969
MTKQVGLGVLSTAHHKIGTEILTVGWGATCMGGFPDLSKVAFERSETQPCILREVVDRPNLGDHRPLFSTGHYNKSNSDPFLR